MSVSSMDDLLEVKVDGGGHKWGQRKGDKHTFYCKICRTELNSRETKLSHESGEKHQKRLRESRLSHDPESAIERIPNPVAKKQKNPERLRVKIKKTREPAVGLEFVREYIPESNDEMEPWYDCQICGKKGEANAMFNHVLGKDHRAAFFTRVSRSKTDYTDCLSRELLRMADRRQENADIDKLVETIRGDEKYPWPAGKAPWSMERMNTTKMLKTNNNRSRHRPLSLWGEITGDSSLLALEYCASVMRIVKKLQSEENFAEKLITNGMIDALQELVMIVDAGNELEENLRLKKEAFDYKQECKMEQD